MNVKLISYTPEPLKTICFAQGMMRGQHSRVLSEISEEESELSFRDAIATKLKGPLEFINGVFVISGVSRAFTHQLVRHRTASFIQESLRFSVKSGNQFEYLPIKNLNEEQTGIYIQAMEDVQYWYETLIDEGVPTEDARGVLPTNILTSIMFGANYRVLFEMAESRLCLQTQEEFRQVMQLIKSCVKEWHPLLAEELRVSCIRDGFCSWGSVLDRPCPLQEKYPLKRDLA